MAITFPTSPTDGQIHEDSASGQRWQWDATYTSWSSIGAGEYANSELVIYKTDFANTNVEIDFTNVSIGSGHTIFAADQNIDFTPDTTYSSYTLTVAAFTEANSATSDAATAQAAADAAATEATWANTTSGVAFDQANTATTDAANADTKAGAAFDEANSATSAAGSAQTDATAAWEAGNSAFDQANTGVTDAATAQGDATAAWEAANSAFDIANNAVYTADTDASSYGFVIDEDTMASNDATKLPTQQSVRAYVETSIASQVTYQGGYNASTNTPDLDTSPSGINLGYMYTVTAAGNFFATAVEIGDVLIAEQDNPTVIGDWTIVNKDLDAASIKSSYESNSDTNAFTDAQVNALVSAFDVANTGSTDATAAWEAANSAFDQANTGVTDAATAQATADNAANTLTTNSFTLTQTFDKVQYTDTNYYSQLIGGNSYVYVDTNDNWYYDRTANQFNWTIASSVIASLNATGLQLGGTGSRIASFGSLAAQDTIGSGDIDNYAVTSNKIANNAIDSDQIATYGIALNNLPAMNGYGAGVDIELISRSSVGPGDAQIINAAYLLQQINVESGADVTNPEIWTNANAAFDQANTATTDAATAQGDATAGWEAANSAFDQANTAAGFTTWEIKTTTYTAVAGDKIIANTATGAWTLTLPATPSNGDTVTVTDPFDWAVTNLTVGRNASTIAGVAEDLTCDVKGTFMTLVYDGTTWEPWAYTRDS